MEIAILKNKENESIELGDEVGDYYKLENLNNCTIKINSKLKTLYLNNLKNCWITSGVVETSIFGDHIEESEIKAIA